MITDFLPKAQVQASQFPLHISHLLQNCKKGKPRGNDLPLLKNDITILIVHSAIIQADQNFF